MSEIKIEFIMEGDSDGYVNFACPYCESEFKLSAKEYQDNEMPFDELFCPYCGLSHSKDSFFTDEVKEMVQAIATNYMIEQVNKSFGKMKRSINKSGNMVKMTFKPLEKVYVKELKGKDTVEVSFKCECCNHHMKVLYCAGVSKIFCSYCGVDI